MPLPSLIRTIESCRECAAHLPLGPRPVVRVSNPAARLMIIGQAPGTRVHATGIPWNDPSGDRLRAWLGIERDTFYDESKIAIMPMGFCYPGRGKGGDMPPRPECAPLWHAKILKHLPNIELTLLIGQYAQNYYLKEHRKKTLTETVRAWRDYIDDGYMPLVHPSPRNTLWLKKNPWFERDVIPFLRHKVASMLHPTGWRKP